MDENKAWELYNLINDWKSGKYGERPLQKVIDENFDIWTNVDDKQPTPRLSVIVYRNDGVRIFPDIAHYTFTKSWKKDNGALLLDVTHWIDFPHKRKQTR